MRWVALHIPTLALEIFTRALATPEPFVVSTGPAQRPLVYACNVAAHGLGVRPGMTVAAAQALAGSLPIRPRDSHAEARCVKTLAGWAGQFTPSVSLVGQRGLLLEVSGSLRLFGGLEAIVQALQTGIGALGYSACVAAAPTPLGAWLLARAGQSLTIDDPEELAIRLAALPLALLEPSLSTLDNLQALGVRTLGDCVRLPRDGLARRFGQQLLDALDRALGKIPDPRVFVTPAARFVARLELPAEVIETAALLFALRRLLTELEGFLRGRDAGVQQLCLDCAHGNGNSTEITIGLVTPARDAAQLLMLLRERINGTELPAPVRALVLRAKTPVPYRPCQHQLVADTSLETEHWERLLERLHARLGAQAVYGLATCPDHRPERAWQAVAIGAETPPLCQAQPRPVFLLREPRLLGAGSGLTLAGQLRITDGPERLESGWWDGHDVARDYYIAEGAKPARYWVFRDLRTNAWYLHGLFS